VQRGQPRLEGGRLERNKEYTVIKSSIDEKREGENIRKSVK
jgi:hypothetical protein